MIIDDLVIKRLKELNVQTFKLLYDDYGPKMRFVCRSYLSNNYDLDDIIQEGFLRIFNNISKFKGQGSFEGWMRHIFINVSIDFIRREKKQQRMELSAMRLLKKVIPFGIVI